MWAQWIKVLLTLLPDVFDFIESLCDMDDKEFESITTAWPSPTKTRLARIRVTMKAHKKFLDGDGK